MFVNFLCGVLYNAGLWMDECIGIIGIYLNKKLPLFGNNLVLVILLYMGSLS